MDLGDFNISKSAEITDRKHWFLGDYHSSCLKMLWFATQGPLLGESSQHPLKTKTCFAMAAESVGCIAHGGFPLQQLHLAKGNHFPLSYILCPVPWHSHPMIRPLLPFGTTLRTIVIRVYDRKS